MSKGWAAARVGLGLAQVMGATVSLYLLVQIAVNALTLGAIAVMFFFTALSRLCFSKADRED
jgi:hypothetical protein